jgi:hypothetical protein
MAQEQYKSHIRWVVDLKGVASADQLYSAKRRQRIRQTARLLENAHIRLEVEVLTPELLQEFIPLYEAHILAKKSPVVHPVAQKMQALWDAGREVHMISLYKNGVFIGGMIFRRMKHYTSVYYRMYPHDVGVKTPISVAYLAEKLLIDKTIAWGKEGIIHGRDRNAYGMNSAIGLADFKFRQGARPQPSKSEDVTVETFDDTQLKEDVLLFMGLEEDQWITKALFYSDLPEEELQKGYPGLFTSEHLSIEVRPR